MGSKGVLPQHTRVLESFILGKCARQAQNNLLDLGILVLALVIICCLRSSIGRTFPFQGKGCGFKSHRRLQKQTNPCLAHYVLFTKRQGLVTNFY